MKKLLFDYETGQQQVVDTTPEEDAEAQQRDTQAQKEQTDATAAAKRRTDLRNKAATGTLTPQDIQAALAILL